MATVRFGEFEWDDEKARRNAKKHGVTFTEAVLCFLDPHGLDLSDALAPDRVVLIAISSAHRVLCVVYAERQGGAIIRLISARRATRHEKKIYEEEQ